MKYRFINEHRHAYAITLICRVLRVARAGFYAWLHEPDSESAREDARLLGLIRYSYDASHGIYGARRIFGDLREAGEHCGLRRIERLMRVKGVMRARGYNKPPFHYRAAPNHRAEPAAAPIYQRCAQYGPGDRYHRYRD